MGSQERGKRGVWGGGAGADDRKRDVELSDSRGRTRLEGGGHKFEVELPDRLVSLFRGGGSGVGQWPRVQGRRVLGRIAKISTKRGESYARGSQMNWKKDLGGVLEKTKMMGWQKEKKIFCPWKFSRRGEKKVDSGKQEGRKG